MKGLVLSGVFMAVIVDVLTGALVLAAAVRMRRLLRPRRSIALVVLGLLLLASAAATMVLATIGGFGAFD